jgi:hypothetical protein
MASAGSPQLVLLCEPQCWGFEHAAFNAALLRTVRLAYPSASIAFFGEASHLELVRDGFRRVDDAERIDFRPIEVPGRRISSRRRLPTEWSLCKRMLEEASRQQAEALVFFSVTNVTLLSLKLLMKIRRFHRPTAAVVHGFLAGITARQPRRPWNWLLDLRRVLLLPHPASLRLVVLGDSILDNVRRARPARESQWSALDIVSLWPSDEPAMGYQALPPAHPLRFGYLGVAEREGAKGFHVFCQVADAVAPAPDTAEFTVVGFYSGRPEGKPVCRYIQAIPDWRLSHGEYEQRLRGLTYVVGTAKPEHYRLAASATFVDALAFLKPGIYLRNDYIERYFDRMGDIGYLCDSCEKMVETIKEILSEFPTDRYQRQIENIRKGRAIFEPETVAPRLREILSSAT